MSPKIYMFYLPISCQSVRIDCFYSISLMRCERERINFLEDAAELRLHFVAQQWKQRMQSLEGHGWREVRGIATGQLYHEDVACEVLAPALFETAEKTRGIPVCRGVGSGMLDEINHREHEMPRRHRAAHVEVGHALLQPVDLLLRHDGHDGGHVSRV
jgi:hypothetical protein